MPRVPINHNNENFYKLVCKDKDITECYVGHTTRFNVRKQQHKPACVNPSDYYYNSTIYRFIRDNGGWGNWDMILIERCKCESSLDARKKEKEYLDQFKATPISSRAIKEWSQLDETYYEQNKNKVREYQRSKKEQILEYRRRRIICACGSKITRGGKVQHEQSITHQRYIQDHKTMD